MKNFPHTSPGATNPLRNLVAFVATAAVFGLALMFSVVLLAIILVIGATGWGYLWWRTRALRRQMRNYPPRGAVTEDPMAGGELFTGKVIEGEVIRVRETREEQ